MGIRFKVMATYGPPRFEDGAVFITIVFCSVQVFLFL